MILSLLFPLSITLLIEPLVSSLSKRFSFFVMITSFVVNLFSNLSMNIVLSFQQDVTIYNIILYSWEIGTVILETLIIFSINKTGFLKTLLFVFLANLASFLIGLLFNQFIFASPDWVLILIISLNLILTGIYMGFSGFYYCFKKN